ncbi:MAG TPA: hypothetical protein VLA04_03290, partial [Verrucomicrobiae bacterium]|nr:hypothetical protein [Verrucomicrobiae bacterium]
MKLRNLTEIIESLQLAAFVLMAPVVLTSLLLAFLSGGWWCLAGGYSAVWVVTFVIQSLDMPEPDEKYPHAITAVTLYPLLLVAWLIICLIQWAQHRIDLKNPRIAEILLTQQRIEEMQRALEVFSVSTVGEALYKKLGNELNMQEKELQHLRSYPREEAERVAEEI